MTYRGHIHNGAVVLDEPADLPEGALVSVQPEANPAPGMDHDEFVAEVLKLAKPRPHWPEDYELNHGHYVSGEPLKP